jgi:hypothetical protein
MSISDDLAVALRSIGEALDSEDLQLVSDLRLALMTLSSYAQRREWGLDRALRGQAKTADGAWRDGERWFVLLPDRVQWRSAKESGRRR